MFAIFGHAEAARLAYYGLYALQHRGQGSAGIVSTDGGKFYDKRGVGLVSEVFEEKDFNLLKGTAAIGHVHYPTSNGSLQTSLQPFIINYAGHSLCLAHNGKLTNAVGLRSRLEEAGSIFQSFSHAELTMHLLARNLQKGLQEAFLATLNELKGAYSFILMTEDTLIAARDPRGFNPLCLGMLGDAYVLSAETCALDLVDAIYVREIDPGEMIIINKKGLKSVRFAEVKTHAHCIFEFVYFARPDSNVFGHNVYLARKAQGAQLAIDHPEVTGDLALPFPDSGVYAALGYAQQSRLPFEMGVIRNHYVGRTFIQPTQDMRDFGVRVKLNPVRELIRGKKVVVVDDSIVRGTTTMARVKAIRKAGASEVHMLVASPPCRFPCHYGVDFSSKGELIASSHGVEEIKRMLGLDSLHYQTIEGLLKSTEVNREGSCMACFDGNYPEPVDDAGIK